MKNLLFILFRVLPMPIFLIGIGVLAFISPFFAWKPFLAGLIIVMSIISVFIQFFTDHYFFKRGMQTASIGFIMIAAFFIFGYESQIWVVLMQIVGVGAAGFFWLDVDEQMKNYKRFRKNGIDHLTEPRIYIKLATSRCSMNMYFAVLDEVYKKETIEMISAKDLSLDAKADLRSKKGSKIKLCKLHMQLMYKPWFLFPKTEKRLWVVKLKELLGKDPKGMRKAKLKKAQKT